MAKTKLNINQLHAIGVDGIATDDELNEALLYHKSDINAHSQYLTDGDVYSRSSGVPWADITDVPSILPVLSLAIQVPAMSGTSIIPFDNTSPLITEGTLIATANCTPYSVNSKLIIQGSLQVNCGTGNRNLIISLFKNTVCIGAVVLNFVSSTRPTVFPFVFTDLLMGKTDFGNTVSYTLRFGVAVRATWYINKMVTAALNGLMVSNSIVFSEYV